MPLNLVLYIQPKKIINMNILFYAFKIHFIISTVKSEWALLICENREILNYLLVTSQKHKEVFTISQEVLCHDTELVGWALVCYLSVCILFHSYIQLPGYVHISNQRKERVQITSSRNHGSVNAGFDEAPCYTAYITNLILQMQI